MGCVPSTASFSRGPNRGSWYSRMSRNVSASVNRRFIMRKDADHDHVLTLKACPFDEVDEEANHGSFYKMRNSIKQYKVLPQGAEVEDWDVDGTSTYRGIEPIMPTFQCNDPGVLKPKPVGVRSSTEPEVEKHHYLMRDVVMPKGTNGSLWGDEDKGLLACDSTDVKNMGNERDYAGTEWVLPENGMKNPFEYDSLDRSHVAQYEGTEPRMFYDERKCLFSESCHYTEMVNMQELMEGLEDTARSPPPPQSQIHGTLRIPERESFFNVLPVISSMHTGDLGSPVWKKYYMEDNAVVNTNTQIMHSSAVGSPFNESPRRALSQCSFNDVDDTKSVSSMEVFDANAIGLKILLSPASSSFHPSPVNYRSTDGKSPYRSRKPSMESICGSIGQERVSSNIRDSFRSPDLTQSNGSVYGSESPLFDPSLMATFEEALKFSTGVSSYDSWFRFSIDESLTVSSSLADTLGSFGKSLDRESTLLEQTKGMAMTASYGHQEERKACLSSYDVRCPPRGEGKVVLYFTSLRGVRKTYEDCFDIRLILRGLGVHVDERDVWMHSEFRSELREVLDGLLKGAPQVPQLFIKGRYIGGSEVVKQLHEEGILSCLMEGLTMGLIYSVCNGCGDARFLPCLNCNGSRKVINLHNEVTQCLICNENGLIMCPMCNS